MKKFLNRWMIALILFCIPISILANSQPFSILGSVVNTGDLAGGLRYTIDSDWVVDGWISSRQDSNSSRVTHYWADIYYRNFGIVLSGTDNTEMLTAFAFAVERNITDDIGIGNAVKLIEFGSSSPAYMGGWDVYLILKI
ncbi:hypothetical protein HOH45_04545 [bacterium]|jgi:hypothetical protein|nr:hypothetical protein [bacterium]